MATNVAEVQPLQKVSDAALKALVRVREKSNFVASDVLSQEFSMARVVDRCISAHIRALEKWPSLKTKIASILTQSPRTLPQRLTHVSWLGQSRRTRTRVRTILGLGTEDPWRPRMSLKLSVARAGRIHSGHSLAMTQYLDRRCAKGKEYLKLHRVAPGGQRNPPTYANPHSWVGNGSYISTMGTNRKGTFTTMSLLRQCST
jgi:hypothetical protein